MTCTEKKGDEITSITESRNRNVSSNTFWMSDTVHAIVQSDKFPFSPEAYFTAWTLPDHLRENRAQK